MGVKRQLLYSTYRLLKKTGYFERLNRSFRGANILLFHRVDTHREDSLTTRTALFEELMGEIRCNFKPAPLQTIVERIKNREALDPKTVVITFDDDYKDTFLNAVPVLLKYNIPATFFITSGYTNSDKTYPWDAEEKFKYPLMTWEEVKELVRLGFEVGSHTVNHLNLGKASFETAREEMIRSKQEIEDNIRREVKAFSYPFGRKDCISERGFEIAIEAGYECCCSAHGGKVTEQSSPYNLFRIPAYPHLIEFLMELDNFMTYFDATMSINFLGHRNLTSAERENTEQLGFK
jgi:peptidoglycan/xylan/chitin deacetylase (PgdA/CDA1 family)